MNTYVHFESYPKSLNILHTSRQVSSQSVFSCSRSSSKLWTDRALRLCICVSESMSRLMLELSGSPSFALPLSWLRRISPSPKCRITIESTADRVVDGGVATCIVVTASANCAEPVPRPVVTSSEWPRASPFSRNTSDPCWRARSCRINRAVRRHEKLVD